MTYRYVASFMKEDYKDHMIDWTIGVSNAPDDMLATYEVHDQARAQGFAPAGWWIVRPDNGGTFTIDRYLTGQLGELRVKT